MKFRPTFLTFFLFILSISGLAQTKVWDNIVTGHVSTPIIKVTKVAIYDDRTEVFLHFELPQAAGQSGPLATNPTLQADGKVMP